MSGLSARLRVARTAFDVDVALEVAPGETVAIMGPSGAGKSTILGALAGTVPLDAGEVQVGGRLVDRVPERRMRASGRDAGIRAANTRVSAESPRAAGARRIHVPPMGRGVVLLGQDARLFPHLDVRENVAFGLRAAGMPAPRAREEAEDWLARVGLAGSGGRAPADLSGGEQQRVAVARALAAAPRAVLLDEPLVALDPVTAAEIRTTLRDCLQGVTTVAVTHDATDAAALADRLLVVEAGRVTQSGAVADVLSAPATAFAAAVAGVNRVTGVADAGAWRRDGVRLRASDARSRALAGEDGRALAAVFRPSAVRAGAAEHAENAWVATVDRIEPTPTGVRVHAGWCTCDLDADAAAGLRPGEGVRLSVDPAAVRLIAAAE